jgi:hypothetical protein
MWSQGNSTSSKEHRGQPRGTSRRSRRGRNESKRNTQQSFVLEDVETINRRRRTTSAGVVRREAVITTASLFSCSMIAQLLTAAVTDDPSVSRSPGAMRRQPFFGAGVTFFGTLIDEISLMPW